MMKIRGIVAFIVIMIPVWAAAPAFACPVLLKTEPQIDSTVTEAINHVSLHFSDPIDVKESELMVRDAQGRNFSQGAPQGKGLRSNTITVPVKALAAGAYKVMWQVHCDCMDEGPGGHLIPGNYSFTVK